MAKKLTYAAYVNIRLKNVTKEHGQELRTGFFSNRGKIARYEGYKAYCKEHGFSYEGAPDGYWESKEEPWHKPAGYALVASGYALWFMGKFATTGIRTRNS